MHRDALTVNGKTLGENTVDAPCWNREVIRRFHGAGNGAVVWDGRDDEGRLVSPGIYFVRAEAGGRAVVARVVLLR